MQKNDEIIYRMFMPVMYGVNPYDSFNTLSQKNIIKEKFDARIIECEYHISKDHKIYIHSENKIITSNNLYCNNEVEFIDEENKEKTKRKLDFEEIIIPLIHPGDNIYGHWLIDILPRIDLFKNLYPRE